MERVEFICQRCKKPLEIDASLATKKKTESLTWDTSILPPEFSREQVEEVLLHLDHLSPRSTTPQASASNKLSTGSRAEEKRPLPNSNKKAELDRAQLLRAMDLAMGCDGSHEYVKNSVGAESAPRVAPIKKPAASPSTSASSSSSSGSSVSSVSSSTVQPSPKQQISSVSARSLALKGEDAPPSVVPSGSSRDMNTVFCTREEMLQLFDRGGEETPGTAHPLCRDCGVGALKELLRDLQELERTNAAYRSFLETHKDKARAEDAAPAAIAQTETPTDGQQPPEQDEEQALLAEAARLDQALAATQAETARLADTARAVSRLEELLVARVARIEYEAGSVAGQQAAQAALAQHDNDLLLELKSMNLLNHVFNIWFDGYFATINGLRLGRLPNQPLDWNEVNAAWGEATLLLTCMAKKCGYTFAGCTPVPMGCTSRMDMADKSSYELYGSSELSLGKLFWARRYDTALVAFLSCAKQLGDHIISISKQPEMALPYKIDAVNGKIGGDLSIKYQFSNEEQWTKALKFLLTDMKWMLVWLAECGK